MTYRQKNVTVMCGDTELRIIERTMESLGCSQSAAVRILIRKAAQAASASPFVPTEQET
jgi:hypothetical protein